MKTVITFLKDGNEVLKCEHTVNQPGDFQKAIEGAHDAFRHKFPGWTLFDNVTVIYDTGE